MSLIITQGYGRREILAVTLTIGADAEGVVNVAVVVTDVLDVTVTAE